MDNRSRLTTAADVPLTDAEAAAGGCDTVQLRVLVDSSVIEAYAMRGRAHFTKRSVATQSVCKDTGRRPTRKPLS